MAHILISGLACKVGRWAAAPWCSLFFEIQSGGECAEISICFTPTVFQYYRKQLLLFMVLVLTYCGGFVVFL